MKNAKKVLAMVIVLALAISMAIPAMAGTITIDPAKDGYTYNAYKMADLSYDATANAYKYTVATDWADYYETDAAKAVYTVTDVNGEKVITVNGEPTTAQVAEAAKQAVAYAKTKGIAAAGTATASGVTATITVADGAGYYCVDSNLGVICSIGTDGDNDDVNIAEKNDIPEIEKTVNDASTADVSIGDTVEYDIVINAKAGATNYVVTDNLDKGLTYNADSFAFTSTVDGITVTAGTPAVSADGTEIIFTVNGEEILDEQGDVAIITITYTATLNENAVVDGNGNDNDATLTYGEKNDTTSIPEPPTVYTWSFDISKYYVHAEDGNTLLSGATFNLKDSNGNVLYFQKTGNTYLYAGKVAGTGLTADLTSDNGKYTIKGLDAATYSLVETVAPAGFNKLTTPTSIVLGATTTNDTMAKNITYTYDSNADDVMDSIGILNQSGAQLPSTGGTGTVIFVAVGSILVLAMGVLLVVRKRMSKVVYAR